MTSRTRRPDPSGLRTAPVVAVLVCHDGETWLPAALDALRAQHRRPRHVVAVDTGSTDGTWSILADAATGPDRLIDGLLTLPRDTGFGAAVAAAVAHANRRWGDPGAWLWLLHDDSAPEPGCLDTLLRVAELAPSAAVFGPLALDWTDPRLIAEAGLSTDCGGHRHSGDRQSELDWGRYSTRESGFDQSTEVLAVPSAGSLVRMKVWTELGGFDLAVPLLRDDLDFGWRVNRAGHLVLFVPGARIRHAQAVSRDLRTADAAAELSRRSGDSAGDGEGDGEGDEFVPPKRSPETIRLAAERAYGLRTYLVNCSLLAFVAGLPRVLVLSLLRAAGFLLLRRFAEATAEVRAAGYLLTGRAGLRAARADRRNPGTEAKPALGGLLITRRDRIRAAVADLSHRLIRRRVRADAERGRLPADATLLAPTDVPGRHAVPARPPVGPDALPAGAIGPSGTARLGVGLRRPKHTLVVPVERAETEPARPSPRPRDGSTVPGADSELVLVDVRPGQVLREILLDPTVLLTIGLTVLALLVHVRRLGVDLAGGRLLPVGDLGAVWREYLATWHPVHGGTLGAAPPALAVLGLLGAPFYPLGGPATAVGLLLLLDLPLAGLTAYRSTARLRVSRTARALAAAGYALLPVATAAVAQGRLDAVVVHVLAPPVLAGIVGVLRPVVLDRGPGDWLHRSVIAGLGLAVIGAFSPLTMLLLIGVLLAGFVLLPPHSAVPRGRGLGVVIAALLPVGLLLPWPAVLWQHPAVLLHGVGGPEPGVSRSPIGWLFLLPGSPGAAWWAGVVVVVAGVVLLGLGARRRALPGLVLAALGLATAVVVGMLRAVPVSGGVRVPGWTGPPLLIAAVGLFWAVLTVDPTLNRWRGWRFVESRVHARHRQVQLPRIGAAVVAGLLAVLAAGALVDGSRGALRIGGALTLPSTLTTDLASTGDGVLVLPSGPGTGAVQAAGRLPRFGDADIPPAKGQPDQLGAVLGDLDSTDPAVVRGAVARLGADGVSLVVLPDASAADRIRGLAGDVLGDSPSTVDGRPVARVLLPIAPALLLSPQLGHDARTGAPPPAEPGALGITRVEEQLPGVAVRTSSGIDGRLLVLATEDEPGWHATVDGHTAPVATAWGHQLAVPVPPLAADIRVDPPSPVRGLLLIVQAAAALFTLLTVIPSRRRRRPY